MAKRTYYITTAIDYPSSNPHIGHAYQKVVADILARWHKVKGEDVRFLTGTDEHGRKIAIAAEKQGKNPQEHVDGLAKEFKESWDALNIEYDRFIRTTDEDHKKVVQDFIQRCYDNGDIYKGTYEGLYCIDCEAYYTDKDSDEGKCPVHGKELEKMSEETYFFKLSNYQDFLLELFEKNPEFISPETRKNEIVNRVKEGLKDLSISRTNFDWGIPFPLDENHVTYVWFDALVNYLTGSGENFEYWPADLHLLGKDNTWFHTVYWPSMLKSAGYELPKMTFNHGFLSVNGQKISKSLGNVISPKYLSENYGSDSVRYFIARNFPFASGDDGDFNEKALTQRHNDELADKLGNLVSRVGGLISKNGMEKSEYEEKPNMKDFFQNVESIENLRFEKRNDQDGYGFVNSPSNKFESYDVVGYEDDLGLFVNEMKSILPKIVERNMDSLKIDKALSEILGFVDRCNEYVQEKKPWETKDKKVLYELADSIRVIAILLWPFVPWASERIAENFGFSVGKGALEKVEDSLDENSEINKEILFKKLNYQEENKKENEKVNKSSKTEEIMQGIGKASFGEWEKVDLRVAEVSSVEGIEGADKLWKVTLDVGPIGQRTVCAGLKKHYSEEGLLGKKVIYFSNLEPKKMKGVESQGMILAASSSSEDKVVLLRPEEDVDNGSQVN
ncbi:MAG: methionine--tRNA ligase [Candidatus Pacearchaeota archaeon]